MKNQKITKKWFSKLIDRVFKCKHEWLPCETHKSWYEPKTFEDSDKDLLGEKTEQVVEVYCRFCLKKKSIAKKI